MSEERFPPRKTSGGLRRNSSSDQLLETADDLVDKLDVLADIVEEVDKKYSETEVSIIYLFIFINSFFIQFEDVSIFQLYRGTVI